MRIWDSLRGLVLLWLGIATVSASAMSHDDWAEMLRRYVTAEDRVDYALWQQEGTADLDAYLARLAMPFAEGMTASERQAALINGYNAVTIHWVLQHFPVKSIWKTRKPFSAARHRVDGRVMSLDAIETELRDSVGPLVHSVLVCAARSCPPLRREAYVSGRLREQLEANTRQWLADSAKNEFDVASGRARVSSIFKWYRDDFDSDGGTLTSFLGRYAPPAARAMFATDSGKATRLQFAPYDWGLNDAGDAGSGYWTFYLDYLRNR